MAHDPRTRGGAWVGREAARRWRRASLLVVAVIVLVGATFLALFGELGLVAVVGLAALVWIVGQLAEIELDEALPWRKGAVSERAIGDELEALRAHGFYIVNDVVQAGEGNIDHVVAGPTGVYLVESKHRVYRDEHFPKAARQARKLHDELGVWVTAVICLDRRDHPPAQRGKVWIMSRTYICDWIRAQRNRTIPFEQLARWADGL